MTAALLIIVAALTTVAAFEWIRANGAEEQRDEWCASALVYQRELARTRSDVADLAQQLETALPLPKEPAS